MSSVSLDNHSSRNYSRNGNHDISPLTNNNNNNSDDNRKEQRTKVVCILAPPLKFDDILTKCVRQGQDKSLNKPMTLPFPLDNYYECQQ